MEQPELFVFAGPNGAGKSTLSSSMVPPGTPIFDGDKEFILLKKQFPGLDSGNLYDAVNGHVFSDWKETMQAKNATCAFETNFRTEDIMKSVNEFKLKGYSTRLFFFGLDEIAISFERVRLRVAKGGHDVSADNIKANYEQSLVNLQKHYRAFDQIILMKAASKVKGQNISVYLKYANGKLVEQAPDLPQWVNRIAQDMGTSMEKTKEQQRIVKPDQNQNLGRPLGSGGMKR
jgi:predicted ABC-type ATPase